MFWNYRELHNAETILMLPDTTLWNGENVNFTWVIFCFLFLEGLNPRGCSCLGLVSVTQASSEGKMLDQVQLHSLKPPNQPWYLSGGPRGSQQFTTHTGLIEPVPVNVPISESAACRTCMGQYTLEHPCWRKLWSSSVHRPTFKILSQKLKNESGSGGTHL